jgi:hypothetical protein
VTLSAAETFPGDTGEAFVVHCSPRADSPFPAMKQVSRLHVLGDGKGGIRLVIDAVSVEAAQQLEQLWPKVQARAKREEVRNALAAATLSRDGDRLTITGTIPEGLREQFLKHLAAARGDG